MSVMLRSHFKLNTPGSAATYIEPVLTQFEWLLYHDKMGFVSRSNNTIRYKRGYMPSRGISYRLAWFDPGEITVTADQRDILVQYRLGLTPNYFPLSLMLGIWLFFAYGMGFWSVPTLSLLGLMILFFPFIFVGFVRTHFWLKASALTAISQEAGNS